MKMWKLLNFCILNLCSRFKKMHQFLAHHSKFKSDTNPANQSVICYKNDSSTNNIHFLSTVLPTMKYVLTAVKNCFTYDEKVLTTVKNCFTYDGKVLTTVKNCFTYNEIGFNYCEKLFYVFYLQ